MNKTIWKSPTGKFVQVINPTEREIKILNIIGYELLPTAEEYFKNNKMIEKLSIGKGEPENITQLDIRILGNKINELIDELNEIKKLIEPASH